ncbi:MAG: glycyl-radical enzyme activating protein [Desulfovibrionaceae bacterium]|nr:glycyl-radical enzyme activating protein [Desulfovibrionaceae bacterium]
MNDSRSLSGIVFNIQKYSLHDGPGTRTLVFLKGCPLRCLWCSNPESQDMRVELLFSPESCRSCGGCARVCPEGLHRMTPSGPDGSSSHHLERDPRCRACGACVDVCPAGALSLTGRRMTVREVVDVVLQDSMFYRSSGGGVTLSGGEAALQPAFAAGILRECREEGIHTALETCGEVAPAALETLAPLTDLFLYDIKHMDDAAHTRLTGAGNSRILKNLDWLLGEGRKVQIRVPLVPGCNDDAANLEAIFALVKSLRARGGAIIGVDVLPYHLYGLRKYAQLGRRYPLDGTACHTAEELARVEALAAHADLGGARARVLKH